MLSNDGRRWAQQARLGKESERLLVGGFHAVRRIEKAEIAGYGLRIQTAKRSQRITLDDFKTLDINRQAIQSFADQSSSFPVLFDKVDHACATAECLNAHSTGAGVNIQPQTCGRALGIAGGEHVKKSFTQPVGGGTKFRSGKRAQ